MPKYCNGKNNPNSNFDLNGLPCEEEVSKDIKDIALPAIEEKTEEPKARATWGSPIEFFLSCLGFAVGFGNVWRFPFLVYKNGGAVFLIPYFLMLSICGLPMFFMELVLGQYTSLGPTAIFPKLAPIMSGLGWGMWVVTAMVTVYYNMVFAWSLFYLFASFTTTLPWSNCNNDFNSINCFTQYESLQCVNESMYFYNKTCVDIDSFCGVNDLLSFNETHCSIIDADNETSSVLADGVVHRISSSEDYYKNKMLKVTGTSWEDMGSINYELVGCLALAWSIVCMCMIKGVKSSGKVVYFTAVFPYVVLLILFCRGITLDGAYEGIQFYIMKIDYTKLWQVQVWSDAATQIFYSLSTGFGGLHTLASYNKMKNNCMRDAIIISFANCLTSVFAGIVIFSILGFMAKELNVPVSEVLDSGSGLAFIAYPSAVARMPLSPFWSIMFFAMLITLGLDSQFAYMETIATGLFDSFEKLRSKKPYVMVSISVIMFLLGIPMCLGGGVYMFELLNYFAAQLSVLFITILEVLFVAYCYGFRRFMKNITQDMGIHVPLILRFYWRITWCFLTPASLMIILGLSLYQMQPGRWGSYIYPHNIQILGWMTTGVSILVILLFAAYVVCCKRKYTGKALFQPTSEFCPAEERNRNHEFVKTFSPQIEDKNGVEIINCDIVYHSPEYAT